MRSWRFIRSETGNFRLTERSTWAMPKPGMSFLASLPCLGIAGIENAFALRIFPPGAPEFETQNGCPATTSGLDSAESPGSGDANITTPLNGKPVRNVSTESMAQSRESKLIGFERVTAGI